MRLKKAQKEAILRWVADGLGSDEINELAAGFIPPFSVSRPQVTYYRRTRNADIAALVAAGEQRALSEGLALRGERVTKLKQLATLLERDLFGGSLWLDQVKGVGSGIAAEVVEYEEFNKAEVDSYRGLLDDIAKELGDRKHQTEFSGRADIGLKIEDDRAHLVARFEERMASAVAEEAAGYQESGQ